MKAAINKLIEGGGAMDLYAVYRHKGKIPEDFVRAKIRLKKIEDFLIK